MEPIPLRAITVLLNYEHMISDPRFEGKRLYKSTIADPLMLEHLTTSQKEFFDSVPKSVKKMNVHLFQEYKEKEIAEPPSTNCSLHPVAAGPEAKALTFSQRELIYHETHGHSGCYLAAGLYQMFFDLFPPGQKLLIQICDQSKQRAESTKPALVDMSSRVIFEYFICGPKALIIASGVGRGSLTTGDEHEGKPESHCVLAFPRSEQPNHYFVVDMSRMQYGEAGRGDNGENYFLGTLERWSESMKNLCEGVVESKRLTHLASKGCENEERLKICVKNVWDRWNNREAQGWCEFCGKPDKMGSMNHCVGCKKFKYCCKEHLKAAWKLHKHTCTRLEVEGLELAMAQLNVRGFLTNSKLLEAVWIQCRA